MLMPPVDRYMTPQPWTTGSQTTLAEAQEIMRAHQIRHLPVIDDGKLIGIVSARDLHVLRSIAGVSLHETHVTEAMSAPAYAVLPSAPLDAVVATMSEHKYGSAVVLEEGAFAGVFTTVDACRALSELLQRTVA